MRRHALPFLLIGQEDMAHLCWQDMSLGLRFVARHVCRPEVCRLFDQGQQHYLKSVSFAYLYVTCVCLTSVGEGGASCHSDMLSQPLFDHKTLTNQFEN